MAWAEKLPSGRWRGSYRNLEGKTRSAGTFTREAAAKRAAAVAETNNRTNPQKSVEQMTWNQWEPIWWSGRVVSRSTLTRNKGAIDQHIRPRWGDTLLTHIRHDDIQQWVALMVKPKTAGGAGLAPNTAIKNLMILSGSLKAAVHRDLIPKNPCTGIKKPSVPPMPERFLSDTEAAALRAAIPEGIMRLFFDVCVGTGMRIGEVQAIHWQSVDLDKQTITAEWSWDRVSRIMKAPKDWESRTIPIGATLATQLAEWLDIHGYGKPGPYEYVGSIKPHTGLMLAHTRGRLLDDARFRDVFTAAVQVTNVGTGKRRKHIGHVRISDLRHTYASRLVGSGIPLQQVQYLLGHSSITTTERYAKLAQQWWGDIREMQG